MTADFATRIDTLLSKGKPADARWMDLLIAEGLDQLPSPGAGAGAGATLCRWQALAAVGAFDLSLAKLYEGHTDALAILRELEPGHRPSDFGRGSWGVWAAEAPGGRTTLVPQSDGAVLLHGGKFWCSGALTADHALLTAWEEGSSVPQLVRVKLREPAQAGEPVPLGKTGIVVDASKWHAVGMAGSASVNVRFDGALAHRVGKPGEYLSRAGFWQGGAGIAACWFGGAVGLANTLRKATTVAAPVRPAGTGTSTGPSPATTLRMVALGKVDVVLRGTAAILHEAAQWIDAHPHADASEVALRARLSAEHCATVVLDEVGRALGATPFCLDEKFAQAAADLPVFIRQSHAERDFAALGERVAAAPEAWAL